MAHRRVQRRESLNRVTIPLARTNHRHARLHTENKIHIENKTASSKQNGPKPTPQAVHLVRATRAHTEPIKSSSVSKVREAHWCSRALRRARGLL